MIALENIQAALTEALKQRTITQEELANKIDVNQSMLSHSRAKHACLGYLIAYLHGT